MSRKTLLTILTLSFSIFSKEMPVSLAIKAGAVNSTVHGNDKEAFMKMVGANSLEQVWHPTLAAGAEFSFGRKVSLTGELGYSGRGFSMIGGSHTDRITAGTVELTALPAITLLGAEQTVSLGLCAGSSLCVILRGKERYDSQETDITDLLNRFSLNLQCGAVMKFRMKRLTAGIETRYFRAGKPVFTSKSTAIKNHGVILLTSLSVPMKKRNQ